MYDYFTNGRGLNNLIWVAAFSGEPKADWHPGAAYVDIGGPDTYVKNHDNLVTPRLTAASAISAPILSAAVHLSDFRILM